MIEVCRCRIAHQLPGMCVIAMARALVSSRKVHYTRVELGSHTATDQDLNHAWPGEWNPPRFN
jgi:hypothetical protein